MGKPKIRMTFSKADDEKLRKAVSEEGVNNWHAVAKKVFPFSPRQCKFRYEVYLQGSFHKSQWTEEEDRLLDEKYVEFGRNWLKMVPFFDGRNANNLKNRFYRYHKNHTNTDDVVKSDVPIKDDTDPFIIPVKEANKTPNSEDIIIFPTELIVPSNQAKEETLYSSFTELFDSFNDSTWELENMF